MIYDYTIVCELLSNLMWHHFIVPPGGPSGTAGHGDDGRARQGVQCWAQLCFKIKAMTFRGSHRRSRPVWCCWPPPPVWGTRCRGSHPGTWRVRWREPVGGDWAGRRPRPAHHRSGTPVDPPRGCRPPTWPLDTGRSWDGPGPVISYMQPVGVSVTRQLQASYCSMHLDDQVVSTQVTGVYVSISIHLFNISNYTYPSYSIHSTILSIIYLLILIYLYTHLIVSIHFSINPPSTCLLSIFYPSTHLSIHPPI